MYQGAPFEDPNPPAVEETKAPGKGAPKSGKPAEEAKPEIRMITPDPVLMINESGRLFEFELGRLEKIKKPDEQSTDALNNGGSATEDPS